MTKKKSPKCDAKNDEPWNKQTKMGKQEKSANKRRRKETKIEIERRWKTKLKSKWNHRKWSRAAFDKGIERQRNCRNVESKLNILKCVLKRKTNQVCKKKGGKGERREWREEREIRKRIRRTGNVRVTGNEVNENENVDKFVNKCLFNPLRT